MLIAIVGLGLAAVFFAMKRNAAEENLPPTPGVPATGTSGVPSPGPEQTGNPVGATKAGRLAMYTTAGLVRPVGTKTTAMAALGNPNINGVPLGPPDQEKSLDTQRNMPQVATIYGAAPKGMVKI